MAAQQFPVIALADLMNACHVSLGYLLRANADAGCLVAVVGKAADELARAASDVDSWPL